MGSALTAFLAGTVGLIIGIPLILLFLSNPVATLFLGFGLCSAVWLLLGR